MIDSKNSHSPNRTPAFHAGDPAPARGGWLSSTTSSVASVLRHIPNPAHLILSAPGRALTILALASRGITSAPVPFPYNTTMTTVAAPVPIALPDIPHPPEPAWMAELSNQPSDVLHSREKRSPRGGGRGGGGRSSRGGSRSRSGGSRTRSGGSNRGGRGSNGRVTFNGRPAKATGRYIKVGGRTYKEFVTTRQSYHVGKQWYNIGGHRVDTFKSSLYTDAGKLRHHVTTSNGVRHKISQFGKWLQVKLGNKLTISTLPRTLHKIADTVFRMSILNLLFKDSGRTSADVYFLSDNGKSYKLSCIPSPEDNEKIDIGYYVDSAVQLPTPSTNSTTAVSTASNSTTVLSPSGNSTQTLDLGKKFVKLASAPKGSSIRFAVLNNQDPKANTTMMAPTSHSANTTTTAQETNSTAPATVGSTPANGSVVVPYNATDIEVGHNITQIESLIGQKGVVNNLLSQVVIMNGDEVLETISLGERVSKFLVNSGNDTIMTYSMDEPKTIQRRFTWLWSSSQSNKNTGNMFSALLLPLTTMLTTIGVLKNNVL